MDAGQFDLWLGHEVERGRLSAAQAVALDRARQQVQEYLVRPSVDRRNATESVTILVASFGDEVFERVGVTQLLAETEPPTLLPTGDRPLLYFETLDGSMLTGL